ncbi:hypothetical protein NVV95_11375 [Herbiconiux sp. CPCC 205716]|uniref:Uncharacterized protein n=1 Tax=Herbiconiux gentiana TaxID=2970912 RepID=A0ABT2GFZ8_9MICO|nr:hypothetical protein [Herbiconiux gentiana]MCS5715151.1 hypothetical protein [Herbiconiux gentiana]
MVACVVGEHGDDLDRDGADLPGIRGDTDPVTAGISGSAVGISTRSSGSAASIIGSAGDG